MSGSPGLCRRLMNSWRNIDESTFLSLLFSDLRLLGLGIYSKHFNSQVYVGNISLTCSNTDNFILNIFICGLVG